MTGTRDVLGINAQLLTVLPVLKKEEVAHLTCCHGIHKFLSSSTRNDWSMVVTDHLTFLEG